MGHRELSTYMFSLAVVVWPIRTGATVVGSDALLLPKLLLEYVEQMKLSKSSRKLEFVLGTSLYELGLRIRDVRVLGS